jgi:hypothetical protein
MRGAILGPGVQGRGEKLCDALIVDRARLARARGSCWQPRQGRRAGRSRATSGARGVVSKGRLRFAQDRLAGLADAPRSGKPRTYRAAADQGILALLDRPPPAGRAR